MIEFIILTDQPFSIVESPAFQSLFSFPNFKANMIGRNGVKSRIEKLFHVERNRIQILTSVNFEDFKTEQLFLIISGLINRK